MIAEQFFILVSVMACLGITLLAALFIFERLRQR